MNKFKHRFRSICLFVLILMSPALAAQQNEWSGQVLDEQLNEPLIGVTVTVKGTNVATITNLDGRFSIRATSNQVLQFSYIGYTKIEVKLAPDLILTKVFLKENLKTLDEVVVVGYGCRRKRLQLALLLPQKVATYLKLVV